MYEKNGDKYFVVDAHQHFWDASPDNWVKGQEQYAKGWIDCFHAYMGLGPPATHWPLEKLVGMLIGRYGPHFYQVHVQAIEVPAKIGDFFLNAISSARDSRRCQFCQNHKIRGCPATD